MGCHHNRVRTSGVRRSGRARPPGRHASPSSTSSASLAALMVVFSHAFTTTGTHEPQPIHFGHSLGVTWGHIGVAIFFTTSGYLVAQSWQRQPEGLWFLAKRAMRIWPAFLVTIVLSVFVVGPIATDWSLRSYFTSSQSWGYLFHNAVMSPITFRLPGVFRHQPLSGVNGSLWTLPYEIGAYLGLLLLGMLRLVRWWLLAAVLAVGLVFYDTSVANPTILLHQHWNGLWLNNVVRLGVWFVAGVLIAEVSHLVVRRHLVALAALVVGRRRHRPPTRPWWPSPRWPAWSSTWARSPAGRPSGSTGWATPPTACT